LLRDGAVVDLRLDDSELDALEHDYRPYDVVGFR
jgi:hypothetical protein